MFESLNRSHSFLWCLFISFALSNIYLAYGDGSMTSKGWVFTLGILFPFVLGIFGKASLSWGDRRGPKSTTTFGALTWPWVALLLLVATGIRFSRLGQDFLWPTGDESLHGFLAIDLIQGGEPRFFYTIGEHPPLLIWMTALAFKLFDRAFTALWIGPALLACAIIPLSYWTVRTWMGREAAGPTLLLFSFGFWPVAFGRFCQQGTLVPLWEWAAFLLMASILKDRKKSGRKVWAIALLGLWTGLGSLTFTSWAVVLALIVVTVLLAKRSLRELAVFGLSLALGLLPFIVAVFREGYGHHVLDSSNLGGWFSSSHQMIVHASYVTSLFWGPLLPDISYGPSWGGMLNPFLGSAFFIGLLGLIQRWREPFSVWLLFSLGLCLSPAFLAGDYVELNRIIQVMPFLFLIAVLGLIRLLGTLGTAPLRLGFIGAFLLVSTVLDLVHLEKPVVEFLRAQKDGSSAPAGPYYGIYRLLEKEALARGPGLVMTEFLPVRYGHSLFVSTYPFNATSNGRVNPEKGNWAALVTRGPYQPFLSRELPGSEWHWSSVGGSWKEGGLSVGLIPLNEKNRERIGHWVQAERCFHRYQIDAEKSFNDPMSFQRSLSSLQKDLPLFQKDRFLEAAYWEWLSQFQMDREHQLNILFLKNAIQKGYPASHLYTALADQFRSQGMEKEAREADRMAEIQRLVLEKTREGSIIDRSLEKACP